MNVITGAPMPMGGMPMNNPMMPRQPMNTLPSPMPVPPMVPPQAAGTFAVSADRRKRFGDSLENMLSRPPMVASDQMAGMNVFTGQMMNTAARPPVVQMRNGGIVRNMRRGGTSMADYSGASFAAAQSAASKRNPGRTGAMTHSQLMDKIRGGSLTNRNNRNNKPKPAPVAVTRDDDYTPTSAELNEQMKDMAAIGMPDLRQDQSNVQMPMFPDLADRTRDKLADYSAFQAFTNKYGTQGTSDDRATILAPGTGGLRSPSSPSSPAPVVNNTPPPDITGSFASPSVYSPQPSNQSVGSSYFADLGIGSLPAAPNVFLPDELITESFNSANVTPISLPDELITQPFENSGFNVDLNSGVGSGQGDSNTIPSGGQTGTEDTSEDPRTIGEHIENFTTQLAEMPGNIASDFQMALDAGLVNAFLGGYPAMEKRLASLLNEDGTRKYSDAQIKDYIFRTKRTQENNKKVKEKRSGSFTRDGGERNVVDPCPPGFTLDPVSRICVPIEEAQGAEEEGSSLDLNRSRDSEFNELDDIMKRIVRPIGNPVAMQDGGSVGLNRAADNFLAAMGA